ncbi:19503_t:CDS:2, partial [Gigaspora rosea]
ISKAMSAPANQLDSKLKWEFHSDDPSGEIQAALEFAEHYVIEKFGSSQECQIIVITDGRIPQADEVSKDDHSKQTNYTLQWYKKLLNRHLPSRVTKNHPKGEFTLEKEGAFYFLLYPHTTYKIMNAINVIAEKYRILNLYKMCKGWFVLKNDLMEYSKLYCQPLIFKANAPNNFDFI